MARSAKDILKDALRQQKLNMIQMKRLKLHYLTETKKAKNDVDHFKRKANGYNDSIKHIRDNIKEISGKLKHFKGVK